MSDPTTVTVTGKDSASRETARMNASQELGRKLNRQGLMPVSDPWFDVQEARPGRFYAVASVKARKR